MSRIVSLLTFLTLIILTGCSSRYEQVGYNKVVIQNQGCRRVFSVYAADRNFAAMKSHARSKPYTPGGVTAVLFFDKREETPDVTLIGLDYPEHYDEHLIAVYWHCADGKETFNTPHNSKLQ